MGWAERLTKPTCLSMGTDQLEQDHDIITFEGPGNWPIVITFLPDIKIPRFMDRKIQLG